MSSPPAPPFPVKRRASQATTAASKKPKHASRKASTSSIHSKSHPLRQTSFPPEEYSPSASARSPSVASIIHGVGHGAKGPGAVLAGAPGQEEVDGEDEDEDKDDFGTAMGPGEDTEEKEEREKLMLLIDAFDADQMARYEAFKRANLNKPAVKKIANQVLNQSITGNVATVIAGFTKLYAGDIIERALDIQEQRGESGPLLPDHLREAARRYRLEGYGATGYKLNGGGGPVGGGGGGPGLGEMPGGGIGRMFR